mmetsp:Transcript_24946/g.62653  ORF Transcript_24946/g.62653 Transcript_24946/m.62653 type:complete len:226 (+) Transcript_24946:464-1141(+)
MRSQRRGARPQDSISTRLCDSEARRASTLSTVSLAGWSCGRLLRKAHSASTRPISPSACLLPRSLAARDRISSTRSNWVSCAASPSSRSISSGTRQPASRMPISVSRSPLQEMFTRLSRAALRSSSSSVLRMLAKSGRTCSTLGGTQNSSTEVSTSASRRAVRCTKIGFSAVSRLTNVLGIERSRTIESRHAGCEAIFDTAVHACCWRVGSVDDIRLISATNAPS